MTPSHHSRQVTATYVPHGSFQRPSAATNHLHPHYVHSREVQDLQSPDMIKKEVTSSFDVKPLYPRPCFPKQAQVLPLPCNNHNQQQQQHHNEATVLASSTNNNKNNNKNRNFPLLAPRGYHGEFSVPAHGFQAVTVQANQFEYAGDENFVYIHRQNSFIDVSQMTHHDHSADQKDVTPAKSSAAPVSRGRSRSNDEVDAALTLATCLQVKH